MTDHLKQSISALIDEEASEIEVHRLLREFESDPELKASWVRYQQIRAVSQGQHNLTESQHLDLHSRISAAIAEEENYHHSEPTPMQTWQKNTAGLAVAASLVLAVFVGVNVNQAPVVDDGMIATAEAPVRSMARNSINAQPVSTQSGAAGANHQFSQDAITSGMAAAESESIVAFNEDGIELKELDEVKQQQLREYLMRHDRMSQLNQMNNQTRTVTFPARQGQN